VDGGQPPRFIVEGKTHLRLPDLTCAKSVRRVSINNDINRCCVLWMTRCGSGKIALNADPVCMNRIRMISPGEKGNRMKTLESTITNAVGLHARPAAIFVNKMGKYEADIQVRNTTGGSKWVNAKSILGVLTLAVEKNHTIEIRIEGADEEAAAAEIRDFLVNELPKQD